jgi:hypothetical protein
MTEQEFIGYIVSGVVGILLIISEYLGSKYHIGRSQSIHAAVLNNSL